MNKKIVIGALVAAAFLGGVYALYTRGTDADGGKVIGAGMDNPAQVTMPSAPTNEDTLGGAVNTQAQSFPNWSCIGDRCDANITFSLQGTDYFKLLTNTAGSPLSYKGKAVYVDYIEAEIPTASTSMRLISGTTTQATLNPFLNPGTSATTTFFNYPLASTTASGVYTYPATSTVSGVTGSAYQASMFVRKVPVGVSVLVGVLAGVSGIPSNACSQACGATSSWRFQGSDQSVQVRVHAHAYLRQN